MMMKAAVLSLLIACTTAFQGRLALHARSPTKLFNFNEPDVIVDVTMVREKLKTLRKKVRQIEDAMDADMVIEEKDLAVKREQVEKLEQVMKTIPKEPTEYEKEIMSIFPGAISNVDLRSKIVSILAERGFTNENTLLATSLCCDELARRLDSEFKQIYGNNFNLGGLSGFPFAGTTGFGAMAAHIPDDGSCLILHGPHVGISKDGQVGKVERAGIELVDNCCGSAIAASNYLKGITDGGAPITTKIQQFTDFQQGAVQELILPHGQRLSNAEDRMVELPLALYDSQELLMRAIVQKGAAGVKKNGLALVGGIQINTAPDTYDYFLPKRFDLMNDKGEVVEDLLPLLMA